MPPSQPTEEFFQHLMVVISIVVGLSLTHLLRGLAGLVQHPGREKVYWIHLGWVFALLLQVLHFWWWEFQLNKVAEWHFQMFFLVTSYAILYFFLCALLFPNDLKDYSGYQDYFYSRRKWFFAFFILTLIVDVFDTHLKGSAYFLYFGWEYWLRLGVTIALCGIAIGTKNERFHGAFVIANLLYQLSWTIRIFEAFK